jgi:hypothetical protein
MAVSTGFNASIYLLSGGTCTITSDKLSVSGGTCTLIGDLDTYTKNTTLETIDTTAFGDSVRKVIPGFPGANISMSGSYNFANASQAAIWTEIEATSHTAKCINIKESGAHTWVKGYFTACNSGSSVGSKSTLSAEFACITIPSTSA